jgi:hypothetical protein
MLFCGMTRRTPVGILVIALAGLIAVGCSAPTTAVFQALLDPAGTSAPAPETEAPAGTVAPSTDDERWYHPADGYEMDLPEGWSGAALTRDQTDEVMDSMMAAMPPGVAASVAEVHALSGFRISGIAGDAGNESELAPVLIVLAEPRSGRTKRELRIYVRDRIAGLPGLAGGVVPHTDVPLPTEGVRFDYRIEDPDLGALRVRSYLFRFGSQAYLMNFVAPDSGADAADALFDEIVTSVRFGV